MYVTLGPYQALLIMNLLDHLCNYCHPHSREYVTLPCGTHSPQTLSWAIDKLVVVSCLYHVCSGNGCRKKGTYNLTCLTWLAFHLTHFDAMGAQDNLPRLPRDIKFRVLIIGRANAGKTSILRRACGTTESPVIYSVDSSGTRKQVRPRPLWHFQSHRLARFNSNLLWRSGRLVRGRDSMADRDDPAHAA